MPRSPGTSAKGKTAWLGRRLSILLGRKSLPLFLLRREAAAAATTPATLNSSKVPGSGTAATTAPRDAAIEVPAAGEPACEGSKMNTPPAPTVKLDPSGRAALESSDQPAGLDVRAAGVGVRAAENQRAAARLSQVAAATDYRRERWRLRRG